MREMISPTWPLATPSGLMRMRVRSVMVPKDSEFLKPSPLGLPLCPHVFWSLRRRNGNSEIIFITDTIIDETWITHNRRRHNTHPGTTPAQTSELPPHT